LTWPRDTHSIPQKDKPRHGVVAITLNLIRNGTVGFIVWLDDFCRFTTHGDERELQGRGS
jgi:hypothetical protein